jgi:hypothetical protein
MVKFPDEIGKLENAFCDALVTSQEQAERMITELTKTFPGVTREQVTNGFCFGKGSSLAG